MWFYEQLVKLSSRNFILSIVFMKSLGVKLTFDISTELSTKQNKKAPIRVLFFFKAFA